MNQIEISGRLFEMAPIRQTPAGVDMLDLVLEHNSVVLEANVPRKLEFLLEARAVGEVASQIAKLNLGDNVAIQGFIAPRRKNANRFILHIQKIKTM